MIEQRLEQDGTGIYRRNGNKPIVDQLEDEMNKNIETMKSDHELMKGRGQIFSPHFLRTLIGPSLHLDLTLILLSSYHHLTLTLPLSYPHLTLTLPSFNLYSKRLRVTRVYMDLKIRRKECSIGAEEFFP